MATDEPPTAEQATHSSYLAPPFPNLGMRTSGTVTPTHGSVTQTITSGRDSRSITPEPLVLRLRGSHEPTPEAEEAENGPGSGNDRRRRIQWAEDVVDNEGLGRKKSKVCCIYHKDREFGESSSDDSSSSSDSDSSDDGGGSSSGADDGSARPVGGKKSGKKGRRGRGKHNHDHGDGDCGHDRRAGGRRPSPNAYERMPKYNVKPLNGNLPGQGNTEGGVKG